ncbi:hypothetical protein HF641_12560 [Acidithiobacillus ferridurans]|nr:alkaline phosphatase family protein [Acidithiobacillus ferridurans]MBU2733552.1 hypothetical protein [Acidithiobacillus ferridurans]
MQHWSHRQFLQALGAGSAAGLVSHPLSALAAAGNKDQIAGLRQHIRHFVVIYQKNRSFDHYFGAYRHPRGAADQNIPWDPAHLFFRMQREANGGKMDRFVGMALSKSHFSLDHAPVSDVDSMQAAHSVSRPSGAVLGYLKASASHNEHPADSAPRRGMDYVQGILNSLAKSPTRPHTLVLITYDEGCGFWDHVPPSARDDFGPGTRVPTRLVSAWTHPGYVDHRIVDTTSILRLIETRFQLPPLNERDAAAYTLTDGLDFSGKVRNLEFV